MLKDKIICSKCNSLLLTKELNKIFPICPNCNGFKIFKLEQAVIYYNQEIFNHEVLFKANFSQNSFHKLIDFGMLLRDLRSLDVSNLYGSEVRSDGTHVFSYYYFTVGELLIRFLHNNPISGEFEDFDIEKLIEWILKYYDILHKKQKIKQENAILVEHDNKYHFYYTNQYVEFMKSLEDFGIGSKNDVNQLSKQAEILETHFGDDIYELSRILLFANLYIYLPGTMTSYLSIDFELKMAHNYGETKEDKKKIEEEKLKYLIFTRKVILFWISEIEKSKYNNKDRFSIGASQFKHQTINFLKSKSFYRDFIQPFIASFKNNKHCAIFINNTKDDKIYFTKNSLDTYAKIFEIQIEYKDLKIIAEDKMNMYFSKKVSSILEDFGFQMHDNSNPPILLEELQIKKNAPEWDLMGIKENELYIIELKAFHPSIKFEYPHAKKRRDKRYNKFEYQFLKPTTGILDWIRENFIINYPSKGKITLRKSHIRNEVQSPNLILNFSPNLKIEKIIPVYINQLNEIPYIENPKVNIICFRDLNEFIEQNDKIFYQ